MANRGRHAKKIDTVHWDLVQEVFIAQGAGAAGKTAIAAQHTPTTILRTRGEWAAGFSAGIGDAIGVSVTAGLILVPEGTGTTVLWSPNTDFDAPWFWWDTFSLIYQEMVGDAIWTSNLSDARRVVDSKAMRRVRNTEVQMVVENVTISGLTGSTVDVVMTARLLAGE